MPDIVVDDPEYNQLTNNQKQLLQELVKPEADALQEFYESELAEMGKLEDLDHKHSKKTFVTVSKLLSSGLSKAQIKSLITILNIEKVDEIVDEIEGNDLFDIDDIDEDEVSQTSLDRVGFDCNRFHWTLRCVDELDEYMVTLIQSKTRGNQSRLKSKAEGRITMRQKLADESKVKDQLRSAGFGEEEIEYHYQNHYLKGSLKKRKQKGKRKGKKKELKTKGIHKMRRTAITARRGVRRVARSARRTGRRVRSRTRRRARTGRAKPKRTRSNRKKTKRIRKKHMVGGDLHDKLWMNWLRSIKHGNSSMDEDKRKLVCRRIITQAKIDAEDPKITAMANIANYGQEKRRKKFVERFIQDTEPVTSYWGTFNEADVSPVAVNGYLKELGYGKGTGSPDFENFWDNIRPLTKNAWG